jgi:hypothetical protein
MRAKRGFWSDVRGDAVKSLAVMAFAVSIASVAGVNLMDKATREGGFLNASSPEIAKRLGRNAEALARPAEIVQTNRQITVDYTPTGSIPANFAQAIVLDPCDGTRK